MSKGFSPANVTRANVAEARAEAPADIAAVVPKIGCFVMKDGVKLLALNGATLADITKADKSEALVELTEGSAAELLALPLAEGEESVTLETRLNRMWDFAVQRDLPVTPLIAGVVAATLFDEGAFDRYPDAKVQSDIIDTILPELAERAMQERNPMAALLAALQRMGASSEAPEATKPTLH